LNDDWFESLHIASQNNRNLGSAVDAIGVSDRIFQPHTFEDTQYVAKNNPEYYALILEELGLLNEPGSVVMIGDMPYDDVLPAQEIGLHTVLVKSLLEETRV
jgi:FMN phosphatase YigB (HAD superfamily)